MEVAMYVVVGATGHTGHVVAMTLLNKHVKVRVVGRSAERFKSLAAKGAEPFSCDVTNTARLTKAFAGAKGVYVMMPPNVASNDVRAFQHRVADSIAAAIQSGGVPHAVTLSSIGADKIDKTGPVVGLHYLEERLNRISGLDVLHLRAGYFMENTVAQVGLIRKTGMAVGPLRADLKLPMIATVDIGSAAATALLNLDFHQKQTRELLGQRDISMSEVVQIIGKAIGRPDLRYAQAADDQARPALVQIGMSLNMADLILEMAAAINSGHMRPLELRSNKNTTPTSYETFVNEEFVPLYEGQSAAA
jgi:uncharacterized protein YbjT (DUF2867 family)